MAASLGKTTIEGLGETHRQKVRSYYKSRIHRNAAAPHEKLNHGRPKDIQVVALSRFREDGVGFPPCLSSGATLYISNPR